MTHLKSGTENPEDILCPGAVFKNNDAVGASREGGAGNEDKHGILVSTGVKSDHWLVRSYVDGCPVPIDAGSERQASHCGSHVYDTRYCKSSIQGGQAVSEAAYSAPCTRRRMNVANKITRDCSTGTEFSDADITIR